jgi:hypothetical protein
MYDFGSPQWLESIRSFSQIRTAVLELNHADRQYEGLTDRHDQHYMHVIKRSNNKWSTGCLIKTQLYLQQYLKLRSHRCNDTNDIFSFYLLGRTHRTALQNTVNMSTTFTWTGIRPKDCYQSAYCCLIQYFLFTIRIVECFKNSTKQFSRDEMLENICTFSLLTHHIRICTAFVSVGSSGLATRVTLTRV